MPGAFSAGDKLDQFAIAPDEKVRRNAQCVDAGVIRMFARVEAIGEQLFYARPAEFPRRQTDVVNDQQADLAIRRPRIEIRRVNAASCVIPAVFVNPILQPGILS